MPDPILDPVNVVTYKEIWDKVIEDNFFLDTPLHAYIRDHCLASFAGGAFMQNNFIYRPMIGGAYARGDNFNITKRQTLSATVFDPKYYEVSVPEYLEEIEVLNKGGLAVASLVEIDLKNAMNTLNALLAVAESLHGQASGGGVVGNRPKHINGWIEAVNNGIDPGWDGSIFTAYGTQLRNGAVGSALNGNIFWCGDAAGNAGQITYTKLEEFYQTCSIGSEEPDLIVGNKAVYAYMKERLEARQRFAQEVDPYWGVRSFRFNSAMVLKDDYFPSEKYGVNDPDLGNWLTGSFTTPASPTAASNLPATTAVDVAEVLAFFNTKKILLRVADSREFGFGFSGFLRAQDNTRVVGQEKAALNLQFLSCRLHGQLYGING